MSKDKKPDDLNLDTTNDFVEEQNVNSVEINDKISDDNNLPLENKDGSVEITEPSTNKTEIANENKLNADKIADNSSVENGLNVNKKDDSDDESSTIFSEQTYKDKPPKSRAPYIKRLLIAAGCMGLAVGIFAILNVYVFIPGEKNTVSSSSSQTSSYDPYSNGITVLATNAADIVSLEVQNTDHLNLYSTQPAASSESVSATDSSSSTDSVDATNVIDYTTWAVKEIPSNIPLSYYTIQYIVENSINVKANKLVESNVTNLDKFGLANPHMTIKVNKIDGSSYTIKVGDMSPDELGRYITADDKTVYIQASSDAIYGAVKEDYVSTLVVEVVTPDPALVSAGKTDPYFLPDPQTGMQALSIVDSVEVSGTAHATPYKMVPKDSTSLGVALFKLVEPVVNDCDDEKMVDILSPLRMGLASQTAYVIEPTAAELKIYGMDNPQNIYKYKYRDQTVTLKFSKTDETGENYAVMVNDTPVIYKVSAASLPFATYDLNDVYAALLFIENIVDVKSILIEDASGSYNFEIYSGLAKPDSAADSVLDVTCNGEKVDVEQFKLLYQDIIGIEAKERTNQPAPDIAPLMTITFTYNDANHNPDVLTFTRASELTDFYRINGTGNAIIYSSYRETITDEIQLLLTGQLIPNE